MSINRVVAGVIERLLAFDKYQMIMDQVHNVDVSQDERFQTLFDSYYGIRRNEDWRDLFYDFFQEVKDNSQISFDEIVDYCYDNMLTSKGNPHPVEASFSSKMLATINPDMPILDSLVLNNMGLKIEGSTPEKRLASAKAVYQEICDRYSRYLESADCAEAIVLFDAHFPDCVGLTPTRKIDWFLWACSKDELISIGKFGGLL